MLITLSFEINLKELGQLQRFHESNSITIANSRKLQKRFDLCSIAENY